MAEQNVLREWLVKIGYDVDKKSKREFDSGLQATTVGVRTLGAAVAAAGAAVAAGTVKMTSELNKLAYVGERTNSTERGILGIRFAAEQLGSSAGEADSAIEGLSKRIRQSPGTENLLSRMGIDTRDANGHLRGSVELLEQFARVSRDMPMYQAQAMGNTLGVPEKLLLAMRSGEFDRYMEEYRQNTEGMSLDGSSKKAQELVRDLNEVRAQFKAIGLASAGAINDEFGDELEEFSDWLTDHGPGIVEGVSTWTEKIGEFTSVLGGWLEKANGLYDSYFSKFIDWTQDGNNLKDWSANQEWMRSEFGNNDTMGVGEFTARSISAMSGMDWFERMFPEISKEATDAVKTDEALARKNKRDKAIRYFMHEGWTRAQAVGIAANIEAESNWDHRAVGDGGKAYGLAQWHPDRQGNYADFANENMASHADFNEQLAWINHEMKYGRERNAGKMLRAATNARDAAAAVTKYYERPADIPGESERRGELAQRIYSETTINVHGAERPEEVATRVEEARRSHDAQVVRNTKPVAQ